MRRCRLQEKDSPMKVKLLVDCEGPNPKFNKRRAVSEANLPHRTIPAGTEIEDDDAWFLCLPEPETQEIRAEPIDDEAKQAVEHGMARRQAIIDRRKKLARAARPQKATPRRKR
jgi:hypothetical protein